MHEATHPAFAAAKAARAAAAEMETAARADGFGDLCGGPRDQA